MYPTFMANICYGCLFCRLTMHYLSLQTDLNLDTGNYAGDTPLHISCQHRHTLLIQYLLRNSVSAFSTMRGCF